jgi:hypothetical protein
MNIKVKAALIVAGIAVLAVAGVLVIQLAFTCISIQTLGIFGALVILAFMASLLFTIVLARLKFDEESNQKTKK